MAIVSLKYTCQESPQTLNEGLVEYYARNPGLLAPERMPAHAARLFREHDAAHVVFGCDTTIRGETLIDSWTIFATTVGLRGYLEYFRLPQVNQIFTQTGYLRIAIELVRCFPDVIRIMWRSRRLSEKWSWQDHERYLDSPLCDVRAQFSIRIV
ncbi:MAG: hypothetical protein HYR72_24225 [Deltaproteobacteria bacterium]|nr:hypothetical protein [Deltaproteobacteria bacterium]MBI3389209.1 hypothetical protein [Deltaproteobacteria bacterium]